MFINAILDFLLTIVKFLWKFVKIIFPQFSIPISFTYVLTVILSTTEQANNFIYFMLGDTAYIILPTVIGLITYKYVMYPVISLLLGVFVNKAS